jgi:hypothetical protein
MPDLVLSIFPGLDLLGRAFEEHGYCVVRGPDVLWGGDVRQFHPPPGRFGGCIGGPPCQSFSPLANLVRARGYEPRFGNLIPEYERCVAEAAPRWFLMEEVPQAPVPVVAGYAVHDFVLRNEQLAGEDGLGMEQERARRFSFGVRGAAEALDLRRWIKLCALMLPKRTRAVYGTHSGGPWGSLEARREGYDKERAGRMRSVAVLGPGRGTGHSQSEARRFKSREPTVVAGAKDRALVPPRGVARSAGVVSDDTYVKRLAPTSLAAEPSYPGLERETICLSIRFPDWTTHLWHPECQRDDPHRVNDCGRFKMRP